MGADIENRLLAQANCASPPEDELLREAAAEIERLRGELAVANECLGEERAANVLRTPAPAMPNGVEGLVASWRAEADEMPVSYRNDESRGYNNALYHLADELEAALQHRGDSRGGEG